MLEFKYDTQLLIEGTGLDEDEIYDYLVANIPGDRSSAKGKTNHNKTNNFSHSYFSYLSNLKTNQKQYQAGE